MGSATDVSFWEQNPFLLFPFGGMCYYSGVSIQEFIDLLKRCRLRSGNHFPQTACILALLLMAALTASSATTTKPQSKAKSKHSYSSSIHKTSGHSSQHHSSKHVAKAHGQRGIDEDRTLAIQTALIREHYR